MHSIFISTESNSEKQSSNKNQHSTNLQLIDNPHYKGLYTNTKTSRFNLMHYNPLYKFPLLNTMPTPLSLSSEDFFHPSSINISKSLSSLHEKSPFNKGKSTEISQSIQEDSQERQVPKNSVNLNTFESCSFTSEATIFNLAEAIEKNQISLTDSYISSVINTSSIPEKANISLNTKEMIMNIHRNFAAQQENDLLLNSITPASSLVLSQLQNSLLSCSDMCPIEKIDFIGKLDYNNLEISAICNESRRLYGSINEEESMKNDENYSKSFKKIDKSSRKSDILIVARRGSEVENFASVFKLSEDAEKMQESDLLDDENMSSPEDEGPLMISTTRMFLNGETASKAKLGGPGGKIRIIKELSDKALDGNINHIYQGINNNPSQTLKNPYQTQSTVYNPEMLSPIVKKLIFYETSSQSSCQILSATACCGFGSGLTLEYSINENDTKAYPNLSNNSIWNILWDLSTTKLIQKSQIQWVSCGFEHISCITIEGKVMTWGYGGSGCLGHGNTQSYKIPTIVNSIFQENILYIECGGYHTIAINDEGETFAWGRGDVNQLGIPFSKLIKDDIGHVSLRPKKIKNFLIEKLFVKDIACGEAHTLLLDAEGRVFSFGWAEYGQLGLDDEDIGDEGISKYICQVKSLNFKVVKVSAGCLFSVCLNDLGQVYIWGNGEEGQLGLGNSVKNTNLPIMISSLRHEFIVDIVCMESSVICLSQSGNVYGWGRGVVGKLMDGGGYLPGSEIICFVPRKIFDVNVVQKYLIKSDMKVDDFNEKLIEKLLKLKNN
ncbi:hypothetical protein SteCoe_3236 [Stentor coeruleus]|uniref:Uncharacterized protein n=1 Tax=Stentor coeruleus TaxID=5963 RepID=A0A1R2CXQ2_9CILI|nr:hypothetical protein SteCoe_3236 [Stentor coeruleus]